jgi:ribosome assembly protein RRB1
MRQDDEGLDDDPIVEARFLKHSGAVNRLKAMPQDNSILASWSANGQVYFWNASHHLRALDDPSVGAPPAQVVPLASWGGHKTEGFAMDWSHVAAGRFASGDCSKNIFLWESRHPPPLADAAGGEAGTWQTDPTPFSGHKDSVEDIAWSPTERDVWVLKLKTN